MSLGELSFASLSDDDQVSEDNDYDDNIVVRYLFFIHNY